ncbi:phosphatidate cytidylyltransferase [Hymenobacter sp. BRD128]|uniref:phosphatidate cytidylyltransferase n=1 Tax=Hymenobacter sp. BRD128 TaxID=2675878 RepID=UPI0020B76266|nr:phosphatidate cytidylyltransferase [Hymenobacter sp. BRD128]
MIWGALAAALLIGCTFGGPISFAVFFAAVQAVILKEFYRIMRASGYRPASWIGGIIGVLIFCWVHLLTGFWHYAQRFDWHLNTTLYPPLSSMQGWIEPMHPVSMPQKVYHLLFGIPGAAHLYLGLVLSAVLVTALLLREIICWPNHGQPFPNVAVTLAGLLYVSMPMSLLSSLAFRGENYRPGYVFLLIFFVWAADTGAYFAGKNFGKHKLAPSISPGKTWEGWAGGAALTLATGWAAGYFLPDIPLSHRLVAAGVVAVFGPLGDLAESMLKRSAGVKDSGTFLPGHGGLLDRFDAFLLVLPVLALLQVLLG